MKEEDIIACDECETLFGEDGYWTAKDDKNYCDYCYSHVFYPKYYGFTRDDFEKGNAGYDINGKPIHKIH
jgi:hypothetical protein|tara:strand:- start:15 stop:224 length:210 start_codon:yes stop_codon:yes gene_type:complete